MTEQPPSRLELLSNLLAAMVAVVFTGELDTEAAHLSSPKLVPIEAGWPPNPKLFIAGGLYHPVACKVAIEMNRSYGDVYRVLAGRGRFNIEETFDRVLRGIGEFNSAVPVQNPFTRDEIEDLRYSPRVFGYVPGLVARSMGVTPSFVRSVIVEGIPCEPIVRAVRLAMAEGGEEGARQAEIAALIRSVDQERRVAIILAREAAEECRG